MLLRIKCIQSRIVWRKCLIASFFFGRSSQANERLFLTFEYKSVAIWYWAERKRKISASLQFLRWCWRFSVHFLTSIQFRMSFGYETSPRESFVFSDDILCREAISTRIKKIQWNLFSAIEWLISPTTTASAIISHKDKYLKGISAFIFMIKNERKILTWYVKQRRLFCARRTTIAFIVWLWYYFATGNHQDAMKFAKLYLQSRLPWLDESRHCRYRLLCLFNNKVLVNRFLFNWKELISGTENGHIEDRLRKHYRNYLRRLNSALNFLFVFASRWVDNGILVRNWSVNICAT